jgi:hypothetical protein
MPNYISQHRYDPAADGLVPLSAEEYECYRLHPDKPVKDRSAMAPVAIRLDRSDVGGAGGTMRRFILNQYQTTKVIGYNMDCMSPPASTGTSQEDTLCVTDRLAPCIAVAVGGEGPQGAKARLFHVFPHNDDIPGSIDRYIGKLHRHGCTTIKAAMHGGVDSGKSKQIAVGLRQLFDLRGVEVKPDEACDKRGGRDTPLGVYIERGEVKFAQRIEVTRD